MNNLLIRQYQETRSKYLKLSGRLQRSYDTGEFYRLPDRKQHWLISRIKKLWEKLKFLEKQLKLAIAAGTITLLLTFSDGVQAQPNFVLAPDKNPCPPPLIYGMTPIVNDVDLDGDLDILATLGDGYVVWYKNVGTPSSPDFIKVPDDDNPFIFPEEYDIETWNIEALVDIDGDGDIDVFTDEYYGDFFRNIGTAQAPVFDLDDNPIGYIDGILIDIDGDGDLDIVDPQEYGYYDPISMEWTSTLKIKVYQNIGNPQVPNIDKDNPVYFEIANQPAGVDYFSEANPMDLGNDNDIDFIIGAEYYDEQEDDYYYQYMIIENTGTSQNPQFTFVDDENNPFSDLGTGWGNIFPADLDDDGDIDALVNESYVGLTLYRNTGNVLVKDETIEDFNGFVLNPSYYFTPSFIDFDGDGDLDMYTFTYEEEFPGVYYENTGNAHNPEFTPSDEYFPFVQAGDSDYFFPLFVDIDSDGDLDCFVWIDVYYGGMAIDYYKNTGTQQSPNYQLDNYNNPMPNIENMSTLPSFADFDGDGDKDMIIVTEEENGYYNYSSKIKFYKNTGDPGVPEFTLMEGTSNPFNGVDEVEEVYGSPLVIADLDRDGDFDVFFSDYYGNMFFRENTGTPTTPAFSINDANNPLKDISAGYYGGFSLVDLDGDGDKDLFITSLYNAIVTYYVNTDPRTSAIGNQRITENEFLKVYPNPASEFCILNLEGPAAGMCDLKIIDINGQVLKTERFRKVNGYVQHELDISDLVPGIYMVNVTQGNQSYISRLVIE